MYRSSFPPGASGGSQRSVTVTTDSSRGKSLTISSSSFTGGGGGGGSGSVGATNHINKENDVNEWLTLLHVLTTRFSLSNDMVRVVWARAYDGVCSHSDTVVQQSSQVS